MFLKIFLWNILVREALEFQKVTLQAGLSRQWILAERIGIVMDGDRRFLEQLSLEADLKQKRELSIGNRTGIVIIALRIVQSADISSYG